MPSVPHPPLRALVIYPSEQSWPQVESCCRRFHADLGSGAFGFLAVRAESLASASLDPEAFDLVILWLTNNLANDQAIMDWLDQWAEQRSLGDGGTLACFIDGEDPNWKIRLWELFTESIGAWRGIDFHCQRLGGQESNERFVRSATRHLRPEETETTAHAETGQSPATPFHLVRFEELA